MLTVDFFLTFLMSLLSSQTSDLRRILNTSSAVRTRESNSSHRNPVLSEMGGAHTYLSPLEAEGGSPQFLSQDSVSMASSIISRVEPCSLLHSSNPCVVLWLHYIFTIALVYAMFSF